MLLIGALVAAVCAGAPLPATGGKVVSGQSYFMPALPKLLKDPVSILKDPLNFVSDRVVSTSDSACNVTVKIPGEEPRVGASVAFSPFENASLSFNQQAEVKVDTGEFTLNPLAPRAALLLTMNLPSLRFPFSLFLHATLCSLATR